MTHQISNNKDLKLPSKILTGAESQLNFDLGQDVLDISIELTAKKPETRVSGPGETHSKEHQLLHDLYHKFEDTLVVHHTSEDKSLKTLVTFDDCKTSAIHRWYTFKEGYSWQLFSMLQQWGILPKEAGLRMLDPFCGVGTTLISASYSGQQKHYSSVVGVEVNPTIRFIAKTKAAWRCYDPDKLQTKIEGLKLARRDKTFPVPQLSTFTVTRRNDKIAFDPEVIQDLLYYKDWINKCSGIEKDVLLLAWLSIIEPVSYARKDGRALRLFKAEERPSTPPDVKRLLLNQVKLMELDIRLLQKQMVGQEDDQVSLSVEEGDARNLPFPDSSFDAICYSPPYLNNIDYTEVYKMELWLKGDITTQEEFRNQRYKTMRSHPSIIFPEMEKPMELDPESWLFQLRTALFEATPKDKMQVSRHRLFNGYIDDLLLTLAEQHRVAVPGAPIVCVVGNSLFGGEKSSKVAVCTDLLVAAAAESVGLEVEQIRVARLLPRRDHQNGWLRESIVVMRKPKFEKSEVIGDQK